MAAFDYFALRCEKSYLFSGQSVVAFAVRNGVCLVSPDPIGPEHERAAVLADLFDMADRNGWSVAVLGAAPHWLAVYESAGMRGIYMGDEAVVDCQSFSIDGGTMKTLRGAYNRVRKHGFTVTFHDPAGLGDAVRDELREVMTQTRRGDCERGFSMTLGRIFDPTDDGLLIAIARGPDRRVGAFCQYVPAVGIDGYSLDLMRRRADPNLPNGVVDFVVVETIRYLRERGFRGLALNFAVFREVIGGERDSRLATLERKALIRFGDTMQIESLWRYNEKFRPSWHPRYAVVDSLENIAAHGVAIAEAESIWELPVVGRWLRPDTTKGRGRAGPSSIDAPADQPVP